MIYSLRVNKGLGASMLKIIVVEDKKEHQKNVRRILTKLSVKYDFEYIPKYFFHYCKELDEEIKDRSNRKIYLLDIELEQSLSGIEIAELIREEDWDSEIIFLTSHDQQFEAVHRNVLNVFDFIERFINMEGRLEKDLLKIIRKKDDNRILKISGPHVEIELHLKNITYIDREERKSIIHAHGNTFKTNLSLEQLEEFLDLRFIRTHRSCIVNKERMIEKNYTDGYFVLDTGEKVYLLSKKFRDNGNINV